MRYYIEEQLDCDLRFICEYVNKLNNFNTEDLIDEIIKNIQSLCPRSDITFNKKWITKTKDSYKTETKISLIAKALEEKKYIFNDEIEHNWNTIVVQRIILHLPISSRFAVKEYYINYEN